MNWLWILLGVLYYLVGVSGMCFKWAKAFDKLSLGIVLFALIFGWVTGPTFWFAALIEWCMENNKTIYLWRKKCSTDSHMS